MLFHIHSENTCVETTNQINDPDLSRSMPDASYKHDMNISANVQEIRLHTCDLMIRSWSAVQGMNV